MTHTILPKKSFLNEGEKKSLRFSFRPIAFPQEVLYKEVCFSTVKNLGYNTVFFEVDQPLEKSLTSVFCEVKKQGLTLGLVIDGEKAIDVSDVWIEGVDYVFWKSSLSNPFRERTFEQRHLLRRDLAEREVASLLSSLPKSCVLIYGVLTEDFVLAEEDADWLLPFSLFAPPNVRVAFLAKVSCRENYHPFWRVMQQKGGGTFLPCLPVLTLEEEEDLPLLDVEGWNTISSLLSSVDICGVMPITPKFPKESSWLEYRLRLGALLQQVSFPLDRFVLSWIQECGSSLSLVMIREIEEMYRVFQAIKKKGRGSPSSRMLLKARLEFFETELDPLMKSGEPVQNFLEAVRAVL